MMTEREKFWNVGGVVVAFLGVLVTLPPNMFDTGSAGPLFSIGGILIAVAGMAIVVTIAVRTSRRRRGTS